MKLFFQENKSIFSKKQTLNTKQHLLHNYDPNTYS